MRTWLLLGLLAGLPLTTVAQQQGRIVGRVVDGDSGEPLPSVSVQVVGTALATLTGVDGKFSITGVPAGRVTLRLASIGYGLKTLTDVQVRPSALVDLNIALEQQAVAMSAVEVVAAAARGSVNRGLDQQRAASGIVNAITAEQIGRSPDSDAAAAVQRVSGVTLLDNKYVQVRGLGERYTTTSLNGARIPSPEPEKKLVPLDIFPAGLLETITTAKTFSPDRPGDFSGAQVDIRMREFSGERRHAVGTSFGFNNQVHRALPAAPPLLRRDVPLALRAAGNFSGGVDQAQVNEFVGLLNNRWAARTSSAKPNTALTGSAGGQAMLLGAPIGYILSGSYSSSQEVRDNEVRALAQPGDAGKTTEIDRFEGSTGRSSTLWGGILSANTLIGQTSRVALNSTFNRSADQEARFEIGTSENHGGLPLQVTRLRHVERSVASLQILGEHEPSVRQRIEWSVTGSRVARNEPDRSEIVYAIETDPVTGQLLDPAWFSTSGEGAVRTFGRLNESALEASLGYRLLVGGSKQHALKAGGQFRSTSRDADNRAYSITAPLLSRADRSLPPEQIFDGRFTREGATVFRLAPLSQGGSYRAADRLVAAYGMIELAPAARMRVITGARIERSSVDLRAQPTIGAPVRAQPHHTDVLPALTINYSLNDVQTLRFSASQTLSRPEYRELAEIAYRDVIGGDNIVGNPDLRRALIRNFDLRWELYPNAGEVFSAALFAKVFKDPIERIYLGTSGTRVVTFMNAASAHNYGVELEARKGLGFISDRLAGTTAFANATVMRSRIAIGDAGAGASKVGDRRAMVGQSPYVLNVGASYADETGVLSATLLYNVVGKRIVSAAERPLPDVYERPRHLLDFGLRFPLFNTISARLDLRNVLDAPFEIRQGTATREYYRAGRVISAGVSWKPTFN